jgi:hypothetical protein
MSLLSNVCPQHFKRPAIMKFLGFTCLAVLLLVSSAATFTQMQINYYSDRYCNDYVTEVDVTWAQNSNCYGYHGGNSVNIANCNIEGTCTCDFYGTSDCSGNTLELASSSANNCLHNAKDYYSFSCSYIGT